MSKLQRSSVHRFSRLRVGGLVILALLVFLLSVSVVKMKEKVRLAKTQLYAVNHQLQQAREDWGGLLLQKNHLESPAKIDIQAKQILNMQSKPKSFFTVHLLPDTSTDSFKLPQSQPATSLPLLDKDNVAAKGEIVDES